MLLLDILELLTKNIVANNLSEGRFQIGKEVIDFRKKEQKQGVSIAKLAGLKECKTQIVDGVRVGGYVASRMLEKKKEFATILAFDVKIVPEAALYAKEIGVRIFSADILYNLFDQFSAYVKALADEKKAASKEEAVFPCILKIIPQYIFNRCNPIVVGVDVVDGILKPGTPLCVVLKKTTEVKKEKTVAMNAEGKPVRVDNNWKAFLSKTGGKKTSVKRKEAPVKVQREEKKGTLLDGFEEVHSRKKIPLVKKK